MRLVTYRANGRANIGLVWGQRVVPLSSHSVLSSLKSARARLAQIENSPPDEGESYDVAQLELRPPVTPLRRDLICCGWNYNDHFSEGTGKRVPSTPPDYPALFSRAAGSVIGPCDAIGIDRHLSSEWDYEGEFAVVIGRTGRSIRAEAALDYVAGYMLANDITARDVQRRHGGQWFKAKSLDGTCPLGPALVTPDEVGNPPRMSLETLVNGVVRQRATADEMVWPIARLIEHISLGMTLRPGHVLLTGTPGGVGHFMEPPVYLRPGDEVVVRSPELGELRNRVVDAVLSE